MANVTIGDLVPSDPLDGSEKMEVEQIISGLAHSRRTTAADILRHQMSIDVDAAGLKLVNDQAAPGGGAYYGTDPGGAKGWFALPSVVPAGATNDIQLNAGGAFGADSDFNYVPASRTLSVYRISGLAANNLNIDCAIGNDVFIAAGGTPAIDISASTVSTLLPLWLQGDIRSSEVTTVSGTTGFVVARLPIYDAGGALAGYIPIYNSIT